jgi:hypothetical protein
MILCIRPGSYYADPPSAHERSTSAAHTGGKGGYWTVISCPEIDGLPAFPIGAAFTRREMKLMLKDGVLPEGIVFGEPAHTRRADKVVVNDGDGQSLVSVGVWRRYNVYKENEPYWKRKRDA